VEHGDRFKPETLVVDVTVPVTFTAGKMTMIDVAEGSAAEHIRARLPPAVRMACAFKTLPAHLLGAGGLPLDCDEFVCGDSLAARSRALELAGRIPGLRPVDAGDLEAARAIERMTVLAIIINKRYRVRSARFRVVGL
jgi:NADPH-dependent F420 reductase